jgi:hypothetical protein
MPKRATKDEPIFIDTTDPITTRETSQQLINEITRAVQATKWPYKTHQEQYWKRDQALSVVFIIGGLRNSEVVQGPNETSGLKKNKKTGVKELVKYKPNSYPLRFKQVRVYPERIIILNAQTVKHGKLRPEIVFPKKGSLGTLTNILGVWLQEMVKLEAKPDSYLFPRGTTGKTGFDFDTSLSTNRAWDIINDATGKFPHWYRAVSETLYGRVIFKNDAYMLKERMGLRTLEATVPYVQSNYKEAERNAEKL